MSGMPDYREIDTPWKPEPIIWRDDRDIAHKEAIKAHVKLPEHNHVVREVRVADTARFRAEQATLTQIEETIARAETEFGRLSDAGLLTAPHEWHVTQDADGKHRALARVAIIDGLGLSKRPLGCEIDSLPESKRAAEHLYETAMGRYYANVQDYELFDGHGKTQFVYGDIREAPLGKMALYLVDIEPIFYTLNSDNS